MAGRPGLDDGEDGRQDDEGGQGRGGQAADDGPAQGRRLLAPLAQPRAIGTMPAIMAQLVMRIGRNRPRAPATAAAAGSAPSLRLRSAKVTSRMALATATPIAMIAPMNDWMLSVVPVSQSATTTPATTAGRGRDDHERQPDRLEVGRQAGGR